MANTGKTPKLPKGWTIHAVDAVSADGRKHIKFTDPKGLTADEATKEIVKLVRALK